MNRKIYKKFQELHKNSEKIIKILGNEELLKPFACAIIASLKCPIREKRLIQNEFSNQDRVFLDYSLLLKSFLNKR